MAQRVSQQYRPAMTLDAQIDMVGTITAALGPNDRVAAFEAEAFLVLSERSSIAPFVRTAPVFMRSAHLLGAMNCDRALGRVLDDDPAAVVIFRGVRRRPCMRRFEAQLTRGGYRHRTLEMEFPAAPGLFDRRNPAFKVLRWQVYSQ